MLVGLLSFALAAPLAECRETWAARDVEDALVEADAAIRRLDPAGFGAARDRALARLACVREPLGGPTLGAVHRVVATGAFLEDRDDAVAPALAGLLAADPGYQLPVELYPEGHPLRKLLPLAALLARDTASRPLAVPRGGWMEIDGLAGDAAPAARAAVVQAFDGAGAVTETRYLWPEDPLGDWARGAARLPATAAAPRPLRVPLLVATAAGAVATGVLYAAARDEYATFHDTSVTRPREELEGMQARANALTIGWVAAGAASVGLGVGLAFSW